MSDLLIRDVPEEIVNAIDARAKQLGLSRTEYLRRTLLREARLEAHEVAVTDLVTFGQRFADLDDPDVMRAAWS